MVQAYSELADELAAHKGVQLEGSIKNESQWLIRGITWLVYLGAVLVFWVYFGRPIYMRIRHGKQQG
jgi:type II secretory pathway component PulL